VNFIQALLAALGPLKEWYASLTGNRRAKDARVEAALDTLYVALNETLLYIGPLDPPPWIRPRRFSFPTKPKSSSKQSALDLDAFVGLGCSPTGPFRRRRGREAALSRLWMKASVKLRDVNHELAEICMLKGAYWASPDTWTDADVFRARIEIHQVIIAARKLLIGGHGR
jgi:hypothetical protein